MTDAGRSVIRYLSAFSGIEAATVAWRPLGWKCVGVAEVDRFACAVLAHRLPDVPNLGDVLADDFLDRPATLRPDVLVGGPPCQDFSVAGKRLGLHGARGALTIRWLEIIHATRARVAVTENVPGWLSANRGHAFGAFLAGLVGHAAAILPPARCGGRWTDAGLVVGPLGRAAWRTLDAQYFGVPQQRRRVFVIFCPGGGADPAAILFEPQGMRGDSAACRAAPKDAPVGTLGSTSQDGGPRFGPDEAAAGHLIAAFGGNNTRGPIDVATACRAKGGTGHGDFESETFIVHTLHGSGRGMPRVPTRSAVRRLTPRECERLQGFPDDWTLAPDRGRPAADGPRYKAIGNSMAVPCMRWIGERISAAAAAANF